MNVISLLTPKAQVAYIYDDCTIRQGLEKLRAHGYTAVPVLARDGRYVGTVSEGDFLWNILDGNDNSLLIDACITELDSLHEDIDSLIAEISAATGEKTCPHCGESVAAEAVYCSKCGAKMDAEPVTEPAPAAPAQEALPESKPEE